MWPMMWPALFKTLQAFLDYLYVISPFTLLNFAGFPLSDHAAFFIFKLPSFIFFGQSFLT
jgi:hypothetical protein